MNKYHPVNCRFGFVQRQNWFVAQGTKKNLVLALAVTQNDMNVVVVKWNSIDLRRPFCFRRPPGAAFSPPTSLFYWWKSGGGLCRHGFRGIPCPHKTCVSYIIKPSRNRRVKIRLIPGDLRRVSIKEPLFTSGFPLNWLNSNENPNIVGVFWGGRVFSVYTGE